MQITSNQIFYNNTNVDNKSLNILIYKPFIINTTTKKKFLKIFTNIKLSKTTNLKY